MTMKNHAKTTHNSKIYHAELKIYTKYTLYKIYIKRGTKQS